MDYAESAVATISMTIRFDNAVQTPVGSGVGALVARGINGIPGDVATG
jgi:2-succinyl-5-enolpyruvyl-6-hydroxy-3-cyclohexene-1-carboxylate synthase